MHPKSECSLSDLSQDDICEVPKKRVSMGVDINVDAPDGHVALETPEASASSQGGNVEGTSDPLPTADAGSCYDTVFASYSSGGSGGPLDVQVQAALADMLHAWYQSGYMTAATTIRRKIVAPLKSERSSHDEGIIKLSSKLEVIAFCQYSEIQSCRCAW